jgi:hypothetical protein
MDQGVHCGILEFQNKEDAEVAIEKLDGRKICDHDVKIKVTMGAER